MCFVNSPTDRTNGILEFLLWRYFENGDNKLDSFNVLSLENFTVDESAVNKTVW